MLYKFDIDGVYPYSGSISLFMDQKELNEDILKVDDDYFSGYFSNSRITDIDADAISTIIDLDTITKISRQLDLSMGNMMYMMQGLSIILFILIIYLLGKLVIEKNAYAISMIRILGYNDYEISQLYVTSTTIVAIVSMLLSLPLGYLLFRPLYLMIMKEEMTGWMAFVIPMSVFMRMLIYNLLAYLAVAFMEYRKLRHIPFTIALKNQE